MADNDSIISQSNLSTASALSSIQVCLYHENNLAHCILCHLCTNRSAFVNYWHNFVLFCLEKTVWWVLLCPKYDIFYCKQQLFWTFLIRPFNLVFGPVFSLFVFLQFPLQLSSNKLERTDFAQYWNQHLKFVSPHGENKQTFIQNERWFIWPAELQLSSERLLSYLWND
jgi:hypothetical protein